MFFAVIYVIYVMRHEGDKKAYVVVQVNSRVVDRLFSQNFNSWLAAGTGDEECPELKRAKRL